MPGDEKEKQSTSVVQTSQNDDCPKKEGDNCLVPGGFNDSAPIGGG